MKKKNSKNRSTRTVKKAKSVKAHAKKKAVQNRADQYKKDLLSVNDIEQNYDKVFEEKLAAEYREFRDNKEHALQARKFYRALMIIIIVVLLVLLLLNFR